MPKHLAFWFHGPANVQPLVTILEGIGFVERERSAKTTTIMKVEDVRDGVAWIFGEGVELRSELVAMLTRELEVTTVVFASTLGNGTVTMRYSSANEYPVLGASLMDPDVKLPAGFIDIDDPADPLVLERLRASPLLRSS